MASGYDGVVDSPPTKYNLLDSQLLNSNNLASTPAGKVLHPLIEDESPMSPSKVSKSLFNDSGATEHRQDLMDINDVEIEKKDEESDQLIVTLNSNETEMEPSVKEDDTNFISDSFPMKIGDKIELGGGNSGHVRFVGHTKFADGLWVGLELKNPKGE